MANSSTKVKFHPLERLDKVDIEATQNFAHNHADNYLGGVIGTTGLLDEPSTISVNNTTEIISIGDCSWLGWQTNHEGLSGARYSAFYGFYRSGDSRNGDISFDNTRAAVQNYYNTYGSLPPTPLGDNYDPATHGFAYPYVYAITTKTDAQTEARRFWSTADAVETTDNVPTQEQQVHTFELVAREDAAPTGGDFPAIKIMRVVSWEIVNGNVVNLLSVIPVTLADNILNIYPRHLDAIGNPFVPLTTNGKKGVAAAIAWMKERQDAMVEGGQFDLPGTIQEGNFGIPRWSLHGLEKYLGDRITTLENSVQRGSFIVRSRFNGADGINDVVVLQKTGSIRPNDFNMFAYRDFTFMYDTTATGGTAFSAPMLDSDVNDNSQVERMVGAILLSIPSEYEGWGIMLNLTSIMPSTDYSYLLNQDVGGSPSGGNMVAQGTKRGYSLQWVINPGPGYVDGGDPSPSVWANSMNTVSPAWSLQRDGSTHYAGQQLLGISIAHPMAFNDLLNIHITGDAANTSGDIATLYVKVDITLVKPNAI